MSSEVRRMDNLFPYRALQAGNERSGFTGHHDPSLVDHGHAAAEIAYIGNNVSGKNDDDVFANRTE